MRVQQRPFEFKVWRQERQCHHRFVLWLVRSGESTSSCKQMSLKHFDCDMKVQATQVMIHEKVNMQWQLIHLAFEQPTDETSKVDQWPFNWLIFTAVSKKLDGVWISLAGCFNSNQATVSSFMSRCVVLNRQPECCCNTTRQACQSHQQWDPCR